jgi:hypothetical protein
MLEEVLMEDRLDRLRSERKWARKLPSQVDGCSLDEVDIDPA